MTPLSISAVSAHPNPHYVRMGSRDFHTNTMGMPSASNLNMTQAPASIPLPAVWGMLLANTLLANPPLSNAPLFTPPFPLDSPFTDPITL
jgi:hypothetical protein